ncbi:MAG TPA: DUF3617 family protein [Caulobacteraceae bacterium]|jgi:hypothetical protein|nr:DUF3617 family protein [Caulobacteraceae bacterium]
MRVPSPLALASLAVLIPAAALAQPPMRRDGLWEMTIQMSAPVKTTMTTRQCTDASQEKAGAMFRNSGPNAPGGVDCKAGVPLPAPGGGWSYSSTCTMKDMTMATSGTVRGDFRTGYHMESVTRMTPAPMPQLAESHMVMDAKWLGPCPADMKPGDMEMNGRRISAKPRG